MSDDCCSIPSAGAEFCELPSLTLTKTPKPEGLCPQCGMRGKAVGRQTVQALISDSLRSVLEDQYFFCRTQSCPVVYFSADGASVYTVAQVREPVYQKSPEAADVPICYCFQHTAGEVRAASAQARTAILADINAGIQAEQCACDIRNPQGSCCLGNVRALILGEEHASQAA